LHSKRSDIPQNTFGDLKGAGRSRVIRICRCPIYEKSPTMYHHLELKMSCEIGYDERTMLWNSSQWPCFELFPFDADELASHEIFMAAIVNLQRQARGKGRTTMIVRPSKEREQVEQELSSPSSTLAGIHIAIWC
jgi:hypothetical protein